MSAYKSQPSLIETLSALVTEQRMDEAGELETLPIYERCALQNRMDSEVADAVAKELPKIAEAVELIASALKNEGRLFYFGAGTSGRLGILDASECPPTFGTNPLLVQGLIAGGERAITSAVEGAEDSFESGGWDFGQCGAKKGDIVVGITASGRTPYVIAALVYARKEGVTTLGVTNNPGSELSQYCSGPCIEVIVGPEIVAGSTRLKAGTAQKMVLNILTTQAMVELGKTYKGAMVDVMATNEKLLARAVKMVADLTASELSEAAQALVSAGGSAKVATLMLLKDIDADQARKLLEASDGKIQTAMKLLNPR